MYLVKGYIKEGDSQKHVSVLVEATGCMDAITIAAEREGVADVTSVSLSPVRECFLTDEFGTYYVGTVETLEEKPVRSQMLFEAENFEKAQKVAKETLAQGYGMQLVAMKQVKLFAVIA